MGFDLSLNLEEIERITKIEFAKYGFLEPFKKDKISTKDIPAIRDSIKLIIVNRIEKAIRKIAEDALRKIQIKDGQIISINENIYVKINWFDKLSVLEDEFHIEIELKDQSATSKSWTFIVAKVKGESIFYTHQAYNKTDSFFLADSKDAKKAFQVILKEAEKIK